MRWAYVIAAGMAALCTHAAYSGLRLLPDFDLYTQGGLGMYPSLFGRAVGAMGPVPFQVVSIVAAGASVLLVARRSARPVLAASLFSLLAAPWLVYAGIDSIGLAVFLAAVTWTPALYLLAPLTHAVLAPYVLLELGRLRPVVRWTLLALLVPPLLFALLASPYAGIITGLLRPAACAYFALTLLAALVLALPLLLFALPSGRTLWPFLIGAGCCAAQTHVQMRYFLPALALTASQVGGYSGLGVRARVASWGEWWRWNTSRGAGAAARSAEAGPSEC